MSDPAGGHAAGPIPALEPPAAPATPTPTPTAPVAPARGLRLPRHLRREDVALFVWLVVVQPLLFAPAASGVQGPDPLRGLIDVAGLIGFAICIGARSAAGVGSGLFSGGNVGAAIGPLFGAVAFAIDDTTTSLGVDGDLVAIFLVALIVLAVGARLRLPPLGADVRRALVTPFVLAASGFFSTFLAGITGAFDIRSMVADVTGPDAGLGLFGIGIAIAGVAIFYVMLVFAPRQVAEKEGSPLTWTVRYLVFLASLILGATWTAILHGS